MHARLFLAGMAMAGSIAAAEPIHVDGILVYGNVHDVSVKDIHEAAVASGWEERPVGLEIAATWGKKPVAEEVINSREIHVYSTWDLGWRPIDSVDIHYPNGIRREWSSEGRDITATPAFLRAITEAEAAYVFPVSTPLDPHLDKKHSRQLDPEALRALKHLLGNKRGWFHGNYDLIGSRPEPANVGFLFRQGNNNVVLFLSSGGLLEGTFNGENTSGLLNDEIAQALEMWKLRYAQLALPAAPPIARDARHAAMSIPHKAPPEAQDSSNRMAPAPPLTP